MERNPKEPVSKWNLLYCMHLRPLRSIKKSPKVCMKTVILSSRRMIITHGWMTKTVHPRMYGVEVEDTWPGLTVHATTLTFLDFSLFLFIPFHFALKRHTLNFFFTYEKINSWPPRNRLSGTVRLLKERSLQHSIKLVTI